MCKLDKSEAFDDLSITEEKFAQECRANPEQTVLGLDDPFAPSGWFMKLELDLVKEHSCLDDLCLSCGCV